MRPTTTILLPLLSLLSSTHAKPGSCPSDKFPIKSEFIAGFNSFCDTYMPETGFYNMGTDQTLVSTAPLKQADGSIAQWVFRISIWTSNSYNAMLVDKQVDRDICKRQFQAMLDIGGIDRDWCTVDGQVTSGDFGTEDLVAFKGGKNSFQIREIGNTQLVFESYRRTR